jgi:transcriptional regulator with XRE-family HTH domain
MSLREDTGWTLAKTPGERLRWARRASGYTQEGFADAAGKSLGVGRGGYRKYEADETPLTFEKASPWARKLKISWGWLMDGKGNPWREDIKKFSSEAESVAELVDSAPEGDRAEIVAAIKTLLRRTA